MQRSACMIHNTLVTFVTALVLLLLFFFFRRRHRLRRRVSACLFLNNSQHAEGSICVGFFTCSVVFRTRNCRNVRGRLSLLNIIFDLN